MSGGIADGTGKVLTIDDLVEALDRREKSQNNVPKVDTFHFNGERVSDWLHLVEQAIVGLSDAVKFQRILKYVLHGHHQEVEKVVNAANGSWARFKDGMQRKYRLGNDLLTIADLVAMNRDDFTTVGAFVQEFKKAARKVSGISEEAQCAIFLELLTASEASELTSHGGGSVKLTWATIDKGVEEGSLDQVEQHQMRLQRRKRKERDATASRTPGVKRIVTDVLAELGYGKDEVIQKKVVTPIQGKGKVPVIKEDVQEEWEEEEPVPQHLSKALRKQRNLTQGGRGSGKGQAPQAVVIASPNASGPSQAAVPPFGQWPLPVFSTFVPWGSPTASGQMIPYAGPQMSMPPPSYPAAQAQPMVPPPSPAPSSQGSVAGGGDQGQSNPGNGGRGGGRGRGRNGRGRGGGRWDNQGYQGQGNQRGQGEEDRRAEQRARKRGSQEEAEPELRDITPKKNKYAVRLEEGFDVERVIDRLLEGHNDLMTLKEILTSVPRLRNELKGRFSRRLVPSVHLSVILPKEAEWAEPGTKMDWKCVACGMVDLVVKGTKCATMVDTGVEMNIIKEANALRFGLEIDNSDCGILHGANCKAVFCGTASNVLIEIGRVKVSTCFFAMPDVDHAILLGRSFLRRTETLMFNKHDGSLILVLCDPTCGNYEIITCRNTGPRSIRNRPNLSSFTIEESEDERRRLLAEPEGEVREEAFSLSLSDVNKAMDIVATHEMADPYDIQALREQVLECPQAGEMEPNGTLRWVQDLQRLNAVTVRDAGGLPNGDALSDFAKTAMPRGGRETRPPRRPLGASGGYERHGSHHREGTPVYNDGDIELFLDDFRGESPQHAREEVAPSGGSLQELEAHLDVSQWRVPQAGKGHDEPTGDMPQEEVHQPRRETRQSAERGAIEEVIEVEEDTPPQAHAAELGPEIVSEIAREEEARQEEIPSPPPEAILSPGVRVEMDQEQTDWRREAVPTIDRYLAAHALEHPDIEEPVPMEPPREPRQPEGEMGVEIPGRADHRTRGSTSRGDSRGETDQSWEALGGNLAGKAEIRGSRGTPRSATTA
ncbi:hypothetical protein CBR_g49130 [Chara braunii]|uniref:Aspartic peptidase DDI1-type domain-containing protein n=1 Tax=Chara braunii TaxID=69332 RepID=A0A388K4S1_CHABU|nr:hypothetical protein CBR_g49130 [Chara braunii]|eukprot:GBG65058.1 hypothetical protein CBR_g49130 [Chara braunii]